MRRKPPHRGAAPVADDGGGSRLDRIAFGLFAAGLVLAFTTGGLDQFALPKLLVLHVYLLFIALRWARALTAGRVHVLPRSLALIAAASAAWWTVTTLTARRPVTALFGMWGRYNGLATMLAELAVFFFLATGGLTRREVERRLALLGVALGAAAVYALLQAFGLDPIAWPEGRPAATMAQPVVFGGVLALFLPVAAAFAAGGPTPVVRRCWGVIAVTLTLALALTLARGPWVAAVFGAVVFTILAIPGAPALQRRFARLALSGALAMAGLLALSPATRTALVGRAATLGALPRDASVGYRLDFARAAVAMLEDHPATGVGWENFGLLYPAYRSRSAPTGTIEADLVPTMVHSGPLQVAVSGGFPALAMRIAFLAAMLVLVERRRRTDESAGARLLGAAFLGSIAAFVVQDLTGWPHVALDAIAYAVLGLAVAWALDGRAKVARPIAGRVALAAAIAAGAAAMAFDTGRRLAADRRMFEARGLDVRSAWGSVEEKVRSVLALSPDRAWANDAAAQIYVRRVAAAGDREAYERAIELTRTAHAANPFDPYLRLRRTELDLVAVDRGLIPRVSPEGEAALEDARSMTAGSARVRQVEASLDRKAGGSRVLWIEPSASAGFGPPGSLVVGGVAPKALPGTRVFLHWRDVARGSAWTTEPYAPVPDRDGAWVIAISGVAAGGTYEVYATSETWSYGPCTYPGLGKIQLCSPLALIAPHPVGDGTARALMFAGLVPDRSDPKSVVLGFRDVTRRSPWVRDEFLPASSAARIAYPDDTPGHWYRMMPEADLSDEYEAFVATANERFGPCTYPGDGRTKLCSPIAWIQPQATAGFGPPGSLVVAGALPEARSGAPVFLHWRNLTRHAAWTTEGAAPVPDASGSWTNAIPNADPSERYQIWISSPTTASPKCTYAADGGRHVCR